MEWVPGGELWSAVRRSKYLFLFLIPLSLFSGTRFSEGQVRFYMAEIALALEFMHNHKLIYCDLKVYLFIFFRLSSHA